MNNSIAAKKLALIHWITQLEDDDILENLLALKQDSEIVEQPHIAEESEQYYEQKSSYARAEIQAIADKFPKDKKWTYTDLLKYFPKDLKIKVEILNNRLIIMASPSFIHQKIFMNLSYKMNGFVEENELGDIVTAPMDTRFDENNLVQPNILFISVKRYDIITSGCIDGAPSLVVEIMSPSNDKKEQREKRDLYEQSGVEEYWTIFPKKRNLKVEVLEEGKYKVFSEGSKEGVIQSSVLAGFKIKIEELMPDKLFEEKK